MEALQSTFGDAFMSLPILIIGLIFFLGMLTSNVGLLYLFLGHFLVVPSFSFLANEKTKPFPLFPGKDKDEKFDIFKFARWFISLFIFFTVTTTSAKILSGTDYSLLILFGLLGAIPQFFELPFFFANPIAVIYPNSSNPTPSSSCSILPGVDSPYNSPSDWVSHITFFFGFIMANATALYNEPVPKVSSTSDASADKERQAKIQVRVANRKYISLTIALFSLVILFALLFFRFYKTACEDKLGIAWFPILVCYYLGFAFFTLVKSCGVRPADVLGIVQGMISSELIDNPIVCVGAT
jgi:hypothetical protein